MAHQLCLGGHIGSLLGDNEGTKVGIKEGILLGSFINLFFPLQMFVSLALPTAVCLQYRNLQPYSPARLHVERYGSIGMAYHATFLQHLRLCA